MNCRAHRPGRGRRRPGRAGNSRSTTPGPTADDRVLGDPAVAGIVDLLWGDRPDGAEQLRGTSERVPTQPDLLDDDALELGLALVDVVENVPRDVGLERDVGVGQDRHLFGDIARDRRQVSCALPGPPRQRRGRVETPRGCAPAGGTFFSWLVFFPAWALWGADRAARSGRRGPCLESTRMSPSRSTMSPRAAGMLTVRVPG